MELYNQIDRPMSLIELKKHFPMEIGIKQPYLKISFCGHYVIRNENPSNIVFKTDGMVGSPGTQMDSQELRDKGYDHFTKGEYQKALKCFK